MKFPSIIHPAELSEAMRNGSVRVIEVFNPSPQDSYFIPGAFHIPTNALIEGTPPSPGKLPSKEQLEAVFGYLGYESDQTIVVSDHEGGGWAGRLAWTLDVIQHEKWLYLDGGTVAWQQTGFELARAPAQAAPTQPKLSLNFEPRIEIDELMTSLNNQDLIIWDVRSEEEFKGLRPSAKRSGHIPGAINLDWLELMDPRNGLRLQQNLESSLASLGIRADRQIVTHCQTHHRSGLSYMVGRLLGFPNIRAYDGSWSEWGNRDDTPIEA